MTDANGRNLHDGKCGGKKRQGEGFCQQPAGWGTDHVGRGRCKLHAGSTPARVGTTEMARYRLKQRPEIRELLDQYRDDPDPLGVGDELALVRALLHRWLEKAGDQVCEYCGSPGLTAGAASLADRVSKIVSRIERARAADAISRAEFADFVQRITLIVKWECDDETWERIREQFMSIRVGGR